jgi:hypothetical protein
MRVNVVEPTFRVVALVGLRMAIPFWLFMWFGEASNGGESGTYTAPWGYPLATAYCLLATCLARFLSYRVTGREGRPRGFEYWAFALWLLLCLSIQVWMPTLTEYRYIPPFDIPRSLCPIAGQLG